MRYYYEPTNDTEIKYATFYHPPNELFDLGTLYYYDGMGLVIVQLEYDPLNKSYHFGPIPPGLANDIFEQPGFREFFLRFAKPSTPNGEYPVMNVRKVMWSLRMKPLRKRDWEQKLQALL